MAWLWQVCTFCHGTNSNSNGLLLFGSYECGLGFTVAISGVMLQFASAGIAAGIQLMNMLLGIVITVTAGFVIGPCEAADAACATTTAPVIMMWGSVISLFAALSGIKLAKKA